MKRAVATRALLTLPAIAAIAVLVLNDHVLKARFGGWWTGKLSDIAGLAVFPLLIGAAIELTSGRTVGRRGVAIAAAITAAGFAAIKLWAPAGALYRAGLATVQWPFRALAAIARGDALPPVGHVHLTADPTDLIALPALGVAIWLAWRYDTTSAARTMSSMASGVGASASRANSTSSRTSLATRISARD